MNGVGATIAVVFALAFIVVPMGLVIWLLVSAARRATRWVNVCGRCGYDLHGLGDVRRCPECGQPFHVDAHGDVIS